MSSPLDFMKNSKLFEAFEKKIKLTLDMYNIFLSSAFANHSSWCLFHVLFYMCVCVYIYICTCILIYIYLLFFMYILSWTQLSHVVLIITSDSCCWIYQLFISLTNYLDDFVTKFSHFVIGGNGVFMHQWWLALSIKVDSV